MRKVNASGHSPSVVGKGLFSVSGEGIRRSLLLFKSLLSAYSERAFFALKSLPRKTKKLACTKKAQARQPLNHFLQPVVLKRMS